MSVELERMEGAGVGAPLGFRTGAAAAGIRGDGDLERLDIAVIRSETLAAAAGVFTRNTVKAAPVVISQLTLRRGTPIGAVVVNAGNANACTGAQGFRDALRMCSAAGDALELDPAQVLVCSTGVIGRPLPMERVLDGIKHASTLQDATGRLAAQAIMTTDTRPKLAEAAFEHGGVRYAVGGIAKGAGMIHPDMATLLGFLTTDAPVGAGALEDLLRRVTDQTFNCVTVDGDTSPNDTVLLLANGAAGGAPFDADAGALRALEHAVFSVAESLSEQLVADAEGTQRYFRVEVRGAASADEARSAARTVAGSPLVKSAVHGADPNWGRIVAALGRSGATFVLDRCRISIGGITVFERGSPCAIDLESVRGALNRTRVDIAVELAAGESEGHAWGCDLTPEYVHLNADYTT
ncbi:MAG TPA: bifunctional glutamate N-acetyltransferase/amino-acid acetyltransferase ArgJ [Candidatus Dormibacteraeota bacterium]|nr:bifunctional glutamate N-acetyltransferase/amino-acid acetyltransferase ArgJ [Candidatus Dormibacteraeota bacterium]